MTGALPAKTQDPVAAANRKLSIAAARAAKKSMVAYIAMPVAAEEDGLTSLVDIAALMTPKNGES